MNTSSTTHLAWLLPLAIFIHQVEEYLLGFPAWYSELMNVELSNQDFLIINGVGLFAFVVWSISYYFSKNNTIPAALGTLALVNGLIHVGISLYMLEYSPGTISSIFIYIPLGLFIYKKIFPQLGSGQRIIAISIGMLIQVIAFSVARNI